MIKRFFLADDDADDTDFFKEALMAVVQDVEVNIARNGQELLTRLKDEYRDPDVIFLDINMPVMNGWQCLENLKKERDLKDIPVIMYSTSPASLFGKKALLAGAQGFYEKPTSFKELKEFLQKIADSTPEELKKTLKELQDSKTHRFLTD